MPNDAPRPASAPVPRMPVPVDRLQEGWDVSTLPFPKSPPPPRDVDRPRPTLASMRKGPAFFAFVAAAAIIFLMGMSTLGLQRDLATVRTYANGLDAAMGIAGAPGGRGAVLVADDGTAHGFVGVAPGGELRVAVRDLFPTFGTQAYTVWVLEGDAAPRALGTFVIGAGSSAATTLQGAVAGEGAHVAVSLEATPAATAPTMPYALAGVLGDP